jgi:hypothetical protein
LDHDGARNGKRPAEAGGQRAAISKTIIEPAFARVARERKYAWCATAAGELCKACDYDLAVGLNDESFDRVDIPKEVGGDLSVVSKSLVERTVDVIARDNEVFDRFRTAEARAGGNNLAVRLNGNGISLIDVSRKVSSDGTC